MSNGVVRRRMLWLRPAPFGGFFFSRSANGDRCTGAPLLRFPARCAGVVKTRRGGVKLGYPVGMPNVSRTSIAHVLDRAAQTITAAAGPDGRASRADLKKKLTELTGPEKALVDTFFRYMDHRDAKPGASVTKADIAKALADAKTKLVNAYDLDRNGLSADERAKMGKVGQLAAQIAEVFRSPTHAAREAVKVLVSPKWTPDALPAVPVESLSSSARANFEARARRAASDDLYAPPIARKLTAAGQSFTVVGQFTHDSFSVDLYNANGRKVGSGTGWGTPEQPIEWR
jgi:hypothetical protein